MNRTFLPLVAFAMATVLMSCSKERVDHNLDSLSQTEEATRSADAAVEDLADALTFRSDSDDVSLPGCVVVTDSGVEVYPRTITLDFGDGCTDAMGRTRSGMMHIAISQPWTEVGSTRDVTFENFTFTRPNQSVSIGVEGQRQLVRLAPGVDGESRWERTISTVLTHPDFTIDREVNGIRRWISGEGDPEAEQIFGLTGEGSHTRNGVTRTRTILEELIYNGTCGETVSGTVDIVRPVLSNALLDFGTGECDGTATLTVGSEVYTISL